MKEIFTLLLIITINITKAQNLVLNPSFEDSIPCASYSGPPQLQCQYWFMATGGSVDFFTNVCSNSFYGVPTNSFGYQVPKSGSTYCGLSTFGPLSSSNYREYLEGQLIDTLKAGHTYCVSFYVVNTNNAKYYCSDIGVYLSNDSIFNQSYFINLNLIPQIKYTGALIYDTLSWTLVSGSFIASGGEKFITIGNFNDDTNSVIDSNSQTNLFYGFGYLYIDDVSVVDCTVGINDIEISKNRITMAPNPAKNETTYKITLAKNETGTIELFTDLSLKVREYNLLSGNNSVTIDLSNLRQGVYLLKTITDGKIQDVRKIVVIK